MKLLNVSCEGTTEQKFCDQVLRPHLFQLGDGVVMTLAVGEKDHRHVYGIGSRIKYERVRKFIRNTIKQRDRAGTFFTTLIDLYGLPDDFPGRGEHLRDSANPIPFAHALEEAFGSDIGHRRFIPHVQLHEYETILFADPDAFEIAFEECGAAIVQLKEIAASFPTIEHIDDGRESAPSKRIVAVIPQYRGRKASAGPDIAEFIGLEKIRSMCPHFDAWLSKLESIPWDSD